MKKLFLIFIITTSFFGLNALEEECLIHQPAIAFSLPDFSSQTFIYPRPLFNNLAARQSIWHRYYYEKAGDASAALQILGMYQETIASNNVTNYFTFNGKNCLSVRGDAYSCNRDIRAEWIGIDDPNFFGEFSLNPSQRQAGVLLDYMNSFSSYTDAPFFDGWWFGASMPLIMVKNDIGIDQSISATAPCCPQDIVQAFDQFSWKYARFSDCELQDLGIGNIYLRLGTAYAAHHGHEIGYYVSAILPGGAHQNAKYIFDPFTGNNRHFGLGLGVTLALRILDYHTNGNIILFFNIENELYLNNTQLRTFDLKGKPWSRYLLYNSLDGERNIPGVNILTREVQIKPYNVFDLSTGLRWQNDCFEGEIGYDLWGHGSERIRLKEPFPKKYGIAGTGTIMRECPECEVGATASCSTIAEQGPNDKDKDNKGIFVPITMLNLDFNSAISREVLTNKFHAAIGYNYQGTCHDLFFAMGAFWEIPENNAAFEQFGAWAKLGGTF
ncbi:MAG: hypothetical protein WD449_01815 [Candidatus Babeliales bacterium]